VISARVSAGSIGESPAVGLPTIIPRAAACGGALRADALAAEPAETTSPPCAWCSTSRSPGPTREAGSPASPCGSGARSFRSAPIDDERATSRRRKPPAAAFPIAKFVRFHVAVAVHDCDRDRPDRGVLVSRLSAVQANAVGLRKPPHMLALIRGQMLEIIVDAVGHCSLSYCQCSNLTLTPRGKGQASPVSASIGALPGLQGQAVSALWR